MGMHFGGKPGDCPITENMSDRLLRLPLYNDLSEDDQKKVLQAVLEFKKQ
jgi:dTDP-4-amino-4,6-dideoxygalactose transaminase